MNIESRDVLLDVLFPTPLSHFYPFCHIIHLFLLFAIVFPFIFLQTLDGELFLRLLFLLNSNAVPFNFFAMRLVRVENVLIKLFGFFLHPLHNLLGDEFGQPKIVHQIARVDRQQNVAVELVIFEEVFFDFDLVKRNPAEDILLGPLPDGSWNQFSQLLCTILMHMIIKNIISKPNCFYLNLPNRKYMLCDRKYII